MRKAHKLGKAIAGVALALAMVMEGAPAVALAQPAEATASQGAVVEAEASQSVIKGKTWKLTLPKYWRGKVKMSAYTYSGREQASIVSKKNGRALLYISEVSYATVKSVTKSRYNYYIDKKVTLKNGKKAKLYKAAQGVTGFFVKSKKGQWLHVSALDPRSGDGAGSATKKYMARMHSFGKKSQYTDDLPANCLKAIAKKLSY